jgi:hypothetical protein
VKKAMLVGSLLALIVGCGDSASDSRAPVSKDQLRGKHDTSLEARICRDHNLPVGCDICRALGYLNDGECDTFGAKPDPDCQPAGEPICEEIEGWATDVCLPDDDEPVDWNGFCFTEMEGYGDVRAKARACCDEIDGLWCGKILPPEGDCDGLDDGVADCVYDGSPLEYCVPVPGDGALYYDAVACCEYGYAFCNALDPLTDGNLQVTATALPLPVAELENSPAHTGLMKVSVSGGTRFAEATLQRVLNEGQRLFGNSCDGVMTLGASFSENESADSFLAFLRSGTSDWDVRLNEAQIDALDAWLETEGKEHYRVFYGQNFANACGGSGQVSYNLLWHTATDEVFYLILYPYSE